MSTPEDFQKVLIENQLKIAQLEAEVKRLQTETLDKKDYLILVQKITELSEYNRQATDTMKTAHDNMLSELKTMEKQVAALNTYVNKWKGASFMLMGVGAAVSFLATQFWNYIKVIGS
jgi:hypothetical protein